MCFTNIKNIDDIYYPRNWDNFHNKANSILVENGVLKFQSTSHVLFFSTSTIFYFVLVYIEYLIYFQMLSKKHLFGSEKRNKKLNEELKKHNNKLKKL